MTVAQAAEGPPRQKPEGGIQDGLAAGNLQRRGEGVAVPAAEQADHLHRDVVLEGLQKAAVDHHRHRRTAAGRTGFQLLEQAQQGHRQAVGVEGKDQHQGVRLPDGLADGGMAAGPDFLAEGGTLPGVGQHPGVDSGVGPGAGVEDQQAFHASTSFWAVSSACSSGTKRIRWEAKFIFLAFRATRRRNRACSSGELSP